MFVSGLYDSFLCALLLLKIIVSMKRYYVYVWEWGKTCGVCMYTFLKVLKCEKCISEKLS